MRTYMEDHWQELNETKNQGELDKDFDAWWNEMKTHMADRWGNIDGEDWWNQMRQYMEERWTGLEDNGYYSYGGSSSYGGYGRCGGMRW
jgi:hypothetical protein